MPEEGLETHELREKLEEAAENAEHGGAPWIMWLSLSTAVIAVFAAIAALQSGAFANDAIVQKNDAVLAQSRADDSWSYFQSRSIKAALYATQAEIAQSSNVELAAKFREESARQKGEQDELQKKAQESEKRVEEMDQESSHSLHRHHQFATAVTIFQVAIALSAIAALTRKKSMWWISLAVGAAGVLFFVKGYGLL
jgi:hypothetical protein